MEWPAGQGLRRSSIVYENVLKSIGCKDFVVFKVDMTNAFNLVSRQAVLDECSAFSPEILPWVSWCYGSHPELWHPMSHLSSQSGVQQGDPLGPMLFALVLHKLISTIDADDEYLQLLLQAWYLDDGVLAGKRSAVLCTLNLIEELGPHTGTSHWSCHQFH